MRALAPAAARLATAALVAASLAGCAGRAPGGAPATPAGKDIITASDEPEASRRARLRMELAAGYFSQGQMTTALDEVKLALLADPTLAEAYNLRGLIYANLGDDKLAEESFRRALALNPQDMDAMQNFGYYLCQKKRYPEANAMFDQLLALPQHREPARTLLTKGVCQAFAGQLADSDVSLSRAFELDPANPAISVNLAEVLYRRGEYERARFYIRRINAVPALAGAQTLWLAARIEQRLSNRNGVQELGDQLRRRFPDSRETSAYERGRFDE